MSGSQPGLQLGKGEYIRTAVYALMKVETEKTHSRRRKRSLRGTWGMLAHKISALDTRAPEVEYSRQPKYLKLVLVLL